MPTLTTEQAAERLGISARRVRKLCEQGRLKAERHGPRAWMIDEAAVVAYRPLPPGRPRDEGGKA